MAGMEGGASPFSTNKKPSGSGAFPRLSYRALSSLSSSFASSFSSSPAPPATTSSSTQTQHHQPLHPPPIPRVLAIDLDGTALHTDKTLGVPTRQALTKAHEEGIVVVVASGRMPFRIFKYADLLPPSFYAVAFSGGLVMQWERGQEPQVLHEAALPVPVINSFLEFAYRHSILDGFGIYKQDCLYVSDAQVAIELRSAGIPFKLLSVPEMTHHFHDCRHALKIWVFRRPFDKTKEQTMTAELTGAVEPHGGTLICFTESYEIVSNEAGKDNAVAALCQKLGFALEEDVMSFGDEGNDINLLQRSRFSVAPANASAEAMRAADKVSVFSNDQDCVGEEIEMVLARMNLTEEVVSSTTTSTCLLPPIASARGRGGGEDEDTEGDV